MEVVIKQKNYVNQKETKKCVNQKNLKNCAKEEISIKNPKIKEDK